MSKRPDLSFLTKLSGLTKEQLTGEANWPGEALTDAQINIIDDAISKLPELICIAEMFFDSMVGTESEKSMPFIIVEKTLNEISGTN